EESHFPPLAFFVDEFAAWDGTRIVKHLPEVRVPESPKHAAKLIEELPFVRIAFGCSRPLIALGLAYGRSGEKDQQQSDPVHVVWITHQAAPIKQTDRLVHCCAFLELLFASKIRPLEIVLKGREQSEGPDHLIAIGRLGMTRFLAIVLLTA